MATATTDLERVRTIMDHDRTHTRYVCRAVVEGGRPVIERIARICIQYPKDGAGTLRVVVTDWGKRAGDPLDGYPIHYIGKAGGYGYDKTTAALVGATVGGVELGDHCDSKGRPILDDLCRAQGWDLIGY